MVAHDAYVKVANHEDLSPEDEVSLLDRKLNRSPSVAFPRMAPFGPSNTISCGSGGPHRRPVNPCCPTNTCIACCAPVPWTTPTKPTQNTLVVGCRRGQSSALRPWLGGLDAGQHLRSSLFRGASSSRCGFEWDSLHDALDGVLPFVYHALGVPSVGWGHCGRFPHLRGTAPSSRPE